MAGGCFVSKAKRLSVKTVTNPLYRSTKLPKISERDRGVIIVIIGRGDRLRRVTGWGEGSLGEAWWVLGLRVNCKRL